MKNYKSLKRLTAVSLTAALAASSFGLTAMAAGKTDTSMIEKYAIYDSTAVIASNYSAAIGKLRDAAIQHASSVDLSSYKIPSASISAFFDAATSVCPELFFLSDGGISYYTTTSGGKVIVSKLLLSYAYSADVCASMLQEFYDRADFFLNQVSDELSACNDEFSKAVLLHDEIVLESNYQIPDSSAYSLMVKKYGKCADYARVYAYLLAQIGIKSEIVDSDAINHEWVKVKLDNAYYNVDATWDDPVKDKPGLAVHTYFLLSDSAISSDHYGYESVNAATSTKYDNFKYHNFNSKFVKLDANEKTVYAADGTNKKIVKYNYATDTSTTVIDLGNEYWSAGGYSYWQGAYTGIDAYDGIIYYNTPSSIKSYNPVTKATATVAGNSYGSQYYGLRISGDKLYAYTASDPNSTGTERYIKQLQKAEVSAQSVSLNKTSLTLTEGGSETLTATILPENTTNKNITWTSSATGVATVSNGTVKAVAPGTATITAKTANGKTATCTVTVNAAEILPTGVTLSQSTLSLETGGSTALTATVSPSNATNKTVTWTTSASHVATVTNGTVKALSAGTATITAKTVNGKTATCLVTVTAPLANNSTLSADSVKANTKVTITGAASGGTSPYSYAFYYKRTTAANWTTLGTEFGSDTSASFTPREAAAFDIRVIAKDSAGKTAEKLLSLTVTEDVPALVNKSFINSDIAQIGDDVRLTGAAQGGTGSYTYAFYFKRSTNSKWNKIGTEFGTKTYGILIPKAAAKYDMKVIIKDSSGATVSSTYTVNVVESLPVTNVSTLSADNVNVGKTVTIAGRSVGGTKPVTFEFYFKRSANSKWNKLSYGSSSQTYAKFTPTTAVPFDLKSVVKDKDGNVSEKIFKLTVQ